MTRRPTPLQVQADKIADLLIHIATVTDPDGDAVIETLTTSSVACRPTFLADLLLIEVVDCLARRAAARIPRRPAVPEFEVERHAAVLARQLASFETYTSRSRRA